MADNQGGGGTSGNTNTSTSLMREYRKGNWTVNETMILIEAKKMDDERRMKRSSGGAQNDAVEGSGMRLNKPAELRWKWVEDYCWRQGCLRSQNQCNDKWDNLMRDYKKVRDYERRLISQPQPQPQPSDHHHHHHHVISDQLSYWKIDKGERKEKNLPTNMLPQIYEALVEVVEVKRSSSSGTVTTSVVVNVTGSGSQAPHQRVLERIPSSGVSGYNVIERPTHASSSSSSHHAATLIAQQQQASLMASHHQAPVILQLPAPVTAVAPSPVVAVAASPIQAAQPLPYNISQPLLPTMCDSSDSDTSEPSDSSPAKRRKKSSQQQPNIQAPTPTTTNQRNIINTTSGQISDHHEVASAIAKSASVIAEALQAGEEREERRHRELLGLRERRLKIEESKNEINRQGINGLVEAINNLANSIQAALASSNNSNNSQPPS